MKCLLIKPEGITQTTNIKGGLSGTLNTMQLMAAQSWDAASNPVLQQLAQSIVKGSADPLRARSPRRRG